MYYSSIGILAILILCITNFSILFRSSNKDLDDAHKAYRNFLISIALFYIVDILWSPLYELNVRTINFIETSLYFVIMALSVMLWTKFVITYLNVNNFFGKGILFAGYIFLIVQIIVLAINFFIPIAFWFEDNGSYHTSLARNINLATQILISFVIFIYIVIAIIKSNGITRRRYIAIGMVCLDMIIFIYLQALDPYLPYYSVGCMLGTCILHTFVLEDEKEARRMQLESMIKIEKLQEMELGKTREMAYSDPLTGVKNKMAYIEDVGAYEQRIEDGNLKDFGLIVFDLNDLKRTNDTLGHEAGDNYIKNGCTLICNKFKHSPVYRIGGDEFVVLLHGDDYKNHSSILEDFHKTVLHNLETGDVVIAFGFADYAKLQEKGFMRLFEAADRQMYDCKEDLKSRKLKMSL